MQPIQDQSSVMGADILNNQQNNYYGRSSNYPQRIQLRPKANKKKIVCLSIDALLEAGSVSREKHTCQHLKNQKLDTDQIKRSEQRERSA